MANTRKATSTTTAAKKTVTKAVKAEPEKELDWRAIGIVKEHQTARVRGRRKIERLELKYLAYTASAFIMGMSIGTMLMSWLH